jgi:hypothetical protein
MKVAVCFFGLPRFFEDSIRSFRENIMNCNKDDEIDVFFHLWDTDCSETKNKLINEFGPVKYTFQKPIEIDLNKFKYISNPKKHHKRRSGDQCFCDIETTKKNLYAIYSQFYSSKKSLEFALDNGEYDFYIKTRTDLIYQHEVVFRNLDTSKLYIPDGRKITGYGPFFDIFAMGNKQDMGIYKNIHDELDSQFEVYLKHMHLVLKDILVGKISDFNFDFVIKLNEKRIKFK